MALVADSGAVYALYDRDDNHHKAVKAVVNREFGPLLVPMAILAEIDYLLRTRLGTLATQRFVEGVVKGIFSLEPFTLADAQYCQRMLTRYAELDLGLADAAVIATAERLHIFQILTVDEGDFRAVQTQRGNAFKLLPADAAK